LHCTAVADTHADTSAAEAPWRERLLWSEPSIEAARTVTLSAPVAGPFAVTALLAATMASYVATVARLITTGAIETTRLCSTPCPDACLQFTDDPDSQRVTSKEDDPDAAPTLHAAADATSTVTLTDPVRGPFMCAALTLAKSIESPADMEPNTRAAVALGEGRAEVPLLLVLSAVVDHHVDAAPPVAPSRDCALGPCIPRLDPSTVTLAAPVASTLVRTTLLSAAASNENRSNPVATSPLELSVTGSCCPSPRTCLHLIVTVSCQIADSV
jgi:hypothetical protein